jgi:hypothetical protein
MAKRVIRLLGQEFIITNEDDKAAEAVLPGHLVTFNGNGDLIKHATASARAAATFALEREEMGADIDVPYNIGDTVKVGHFFAGTRVNAMIPSGQNLIKGDFLESNGDGTLKKGTTQPVGRSLEVTGAVTALRRLRVEII